MTWHRAHQPGARATCWRPLTEPVAGIVANLPYTVLDEVEPDVRDWEPTLALEGGGAEGHRR